MSTFYTADLVFVSGALEPGMYVEIDGGQIVQRARRHARRIDKRAPRRPIQLSKNARPQVTADGGGSH